MNGAERGIAFATPEPPLPFGRDTAARTVFGLIRELAARGNPVRLFTLASRPPEVELARGLLKDHLAAPLSWYPAPKRSWLDRKWRGVWQPWASSIPDQLKKDLAHLLKQERFLLQVELVIPMGWLMKQSPRAILSVHHLQRIDYERAPFSSWSAWKSIQQAWRAERVVLKRYRWIRVTTPRLAEAVRALNPKARVAVVPITLDLSQYPFLPTGPPAPTVPDRPVIGLLGTMSWLPTRSAAVRLVKRIWPLIKARVPEAQLMLGGWSASQWLGPYVTGQKDVVLLDDLPHPRSFFERLTVNVYPTPRGSGMKVKVLEAMAYGVPVVTTPDGVEGLMVQSGVHAVVANRDEELADAVVELLQQPSRREAMRQAARRLLEASCCPSVVVDRLLAFYQEVGNSS